MENESQLFIFSFIVLEIVLIVLGEFDIENLDNKEIQSKLGDGSSKEVRCFNILIVYCYLRYC